MHVFQLPFEFEDLPLGFETVAGIEWTFEARAAGRAIIEFSRNGDWDVSDIEIATVREIAGPSAARRWVDGYAWLDRASPIYTLIHAALLKRESESIKDRVVAALEACGMLIGDPNKEHSLGARELGVGQFA